MLRILINGILGGASNIVSSKIYKWHCNINKDKLIEQIPKYLEDIFFQCDYEKALAIDISTKSIKIFKLNDDDKVDQEEIDFKFISSVDIIEDNNVNGDCKYIRLKIITNSIDHPYAEIIFLKPMYLSGDGYFCKDSDMYQAALVEANRCKKMLDLKVITVLDNK